MASFLPINAFCPQSPFPHHLSSSTLLPRRPRFPSSLIPMTPKATLSVEDNIPAEEDSADILPATSGGSTKSSLSGCKTCGRPEVERGCNGEGRIQGGIATVPGFGWWPIKAYRPCPGFLESGGRYRRQGQSMDEVAFGRGDREKASEEIEGEKKEKKRSANNEGLTMHGMKVSIH